MRVFREPRYLISYDVSEKTRRRRLRGALEKANAKRLLKSQWGLRRDNTTAEALKQEFGEHIGSGDKIMVARIEEQVDRYAVINVSAW